MDLARLVVGHCPEAYSDATVKKRFIAALFQGAGWADPWSTPLPKPRETNILLLLRALSNAFQTSTTVGDGAWVQDVRTSGMINLVMLQY